MRLIDADLIQYESMLSAKGNGMYEDVMVAYKSQIDDLPTIEERKTGKWIDHYEYECSVCGFVCDDPYYLGSANFCPNCGADMRGREDDKADV